MDLRAAADVISDQPFQADIDSEEVAIFQPPPGIDPVDQRVRSAALIRAPDAPFNVAAAEALRAKPGVAQASI